MSGLTEYTFFAILRLVFCIPKKVLSGKRRILTYLSTRSATTGFPEKLVARDEAATTFSEFAWPVTLWGMRTTPKEEISYTYSYS